MTATLAQAEAADRVPTWIGPAPGLAQQVAVFFVGIVGVMFAGVGPLLLGGLQASGRLTAAQLGQAGTVELLAMGFAAALAGPLFGARRLRLIAVVCGLAMNRFGPDGFPRVLLAIFVAYLAVRIVTQIRRRAAQRTTTP